MKEPRAYASVELIDRFVDSLRRQAAPEELAPAAALLRKGYAGLAREDLAAHTEEGIAGSVLHMLRLARERAPGEAKVCVYNPDEVEGGWPSEHTAVDVVNDDMPFLLATIMGELQQRQRRIHTLIHPIVLVERDQKGRLERMDAAGGAVESWIHLEIDRETEGEAGLAELEAELTELMQLNRRVVDDWQPMQQRARAVIERLTTDPPPLGAEEIEETKAFLEWLLDNRYTFLGYRSYQLVQEADAEYLRIDPETGLGLLSQISADSLSRSETPLSPSLSAYLNERQLLNITKGNRRARVHRTVHMDSIAVRQFDDAGKVTGEERFVGLLASRAYSAGVRTVPFLRQKVRHIEEWSGFAPGSHDGKSLAHILDSFPRDELFQISEAALYDTAHGILRLQQRARVALFLRWDEFERFVSCLVYVPRERYDFELRQRIGRRLEAAFEGTMAAFYTQMSDQPLARVQFIVRTTPGKVPDVDARALEAEIAEEARSWGEHLREHLVARDGEERGLTLHRRYGDAFPATYHYGSKAKEALPDVEVMEWMEAENSQFDARLSKPPRTGPDEVHLNLYQRDRHIALSDAMPILEDLGLRVEAEVAFEVTPADRSTIWIHDYQLRSIEGAEITPDKRDTIEEMLRRVWSGEVESGTLNRLAVTAGLSWRQVVVLRAYSRYLRQTGVTFSQRYMAGVLVRHRKIARQLVELFDVLFDPDHREDFRSRAAGVLAGLRQSLDDVSSLDEDRILRAFLAVIKATLRTSFYQTDADGGPKSYLSVKLDSRSIRHLPEPKPRFEIFVYSPRVEGIHLRGGMVARGGIRWSDRPEDFRTEILGLMKAQMVKNAVIVPVGAKGGFVVKQPPTGGGREAFQAEGVACYQRFIRGLLDITDNLVKGEVVPPERVVRRDGDDVYLVVAADKGTATFSDIANAEAKSYGFWLGDAFASGGSAGYDHKKMGITARGAWEAVKRHFRELGTNIQKQPFTVVGVGDMSGDVFGNGMLLSRQTRLVGAFNHLHIFIDPDPNPRSSWEERDRLFGLPRSSWIDYDRSKLSPGGAVFDRSAKSIELTPEIRSLLTLDKKRVTPNELIRALLTARVDLLWFGGIGTFVRGSDERNRDVGDRTNDAFRVQAGELRCRVVGEGANLGFTQAARVDFALGGGKINTDAMDNSGGVDTSDHEVNIKIALDAARYKRKLTLKNRNRLLEEMTEEVGALVLRDNYLQTQALSLAEAGGVEILTEQTLMIRELERQGKLDRALEGLPDDEEIAARKAQRRGLTRPELAVLLAYAKIDLYEDLVASDFPDDPLLVEDLMRYFPGPVQQQFPGFVAEHGLRREIISTYITNSTVNRVGPTFVFRLEQATGRPARDVARAYTIARDAFDLRKVWTAIEALDNRVAAGLQLEMLTEANRLAELATLWFLRRYDQDLDVSQLVSIFRPSLRRLTKKLDGLVVGGTRRDLRRRSRELEKQGVPERLAIQVAGLKRLVSGVDIVRETVRCGGDVERTAEVYFSLGEQLGIEWLRTAAARLRFESGWEQAAVRGLVDNLYRHQAVITRQILELGGADVDRHHLEGWSATRAAGVERLSWLMKEIRGQPELNFSMLAVVDQQLKHLVDRSPRAATE